MINHGGVAVRGPVGDQVGVIDAREIEHRVDDLGDEVRAVVLREPVIERRREQEILVLVVGAKGSRRSHGRRRRGVLVFALWRSARLGYVISGGAFALLLGSIFLRRVPTAEVLAEARGKVVS